MSFEAFINLHFSKDSKFEIIEQITTPNKKNYYYFESLKHLLPTKEEKSELPELKPIEIFKNIILRNPYDQVFNEKVQEAFKILASGRVGQRLISKIGAGRHQVFILQGDKSEVTPGFSDNLKGMEESSDRTKGCVSFVRLKLDQELVWRYSEKDRRLQWYLKKRIEYVHDMNGKPIEIPFFITLAHELIHAYHNTYGKNKRHEFTMDTRVWSTDEEYKTIVGFPSKKPFRMEPKITENTIRREHRLPERFGHISFEKDPMIKEILQTRLQEAYRQHLVRQGIEGPSATYPISRL